MVIARRKTCNDQGVPELWDAFLFRVDLGTLGTLPVMLGGSMQQIILAENDHDICYDVCKMRIGGYLNTTKEEVAAKSFNIWLGFSLGNKYFTPDHIRSYLAWALENTRDKIAVIIPDKIQAINYEVKNEYSPTRALSVALRKGDEMEKIVRAAAEELRIPESKLKILRWSDLEDESYSKMLGIITTAFEQNPRFRKTVIDMVKETPHFSEFTFSEEQFTKLAQYIVNELPVLVGGLQVDGVRYDLLPYPGFANLDYLAIDLQEGTSFPEITAQLKSKDKLRLIELYVD